MRYLFLYIIYLLTGNMPFTSKENDMADKPLRTTYGAPRFSIGTFEADSVFNWSQFILAIVLAALTYFAESVIPGLEEQGGIWTTLAPLVAATLPYLTKFVKEYLSDNTEKSTTELT